MPTVLWAQDNTEATKNTKPEVVIDPSGLPPDVLEVVQKGVGAIVRQADDQDGGEAARIRRKGHDAVVSALATKGYFDPVVTLEVGEDIGGDTWDIAIEPGEISKVTHVNTLFKDASWHQNTASGLRVCVSPGAYQWAKTLLMHNGAHPRVDC